MLPRLLEGLPAFAAYFALGSVLIGVFALVYVTKLTPYDEFALIRAGNISAAIAFGGMLLGLALAAASAIAHTQSIFAAAVWAAIGCLVQMAAYGVARLIVPELPTRISADDRAAATVLAAISLAAGLLNAACMTY